MKWNLSSHKLDFKFWMNLAIPLLIAVLSFFVFAPWLAQGPVAQAALESIEHSNDTVMKFSGATLSTSLAISALPDDFASPLANSLAEMSQYFVVILMALFVERLLVVEGIKLAFWYIIPIACGFWVIATIFRAEWPRRFSWRLAALGLAVAFVVPISTGLTEHIGRSYLDYVEQTIAEADEGTGKINDVIAEPDEEQGFFDKLSSSFNSAVHGVTDLLDYFNTTIRKFMNAIAILVVTTLVMPVLTFLFMGWLLKELFGLRMPVRAIMDDSRPWKRREHREEELTHAE